MREYYTRKRVKSQYHNTIKKEKYKAILWTIKSANNRSKAIWNAINDKMCIKEISYTEICLLDDNDKLILNLYALPIC